MPDLPAKGNHGRDSRPMGNPNEHPKPNGIYSFNVSKPQKHLTSPLPLVAESKTTLIVNTAQQLAVAELDNHYF